MRMLALAFGLGLAACGSSSSPPATPPEEMPLPPSRDEINAKGAPAGDDQLRVIDIDPTFGPEVGGNAVKIRGANFRMGGTVKVTFKKMDADVLRVSDDEIVVQVPAGSSGDIVDVVLTFELGGELSLRGAYTYGAPKLAPQPAPKP
jgi:hypothetical protein